MTSSANTYVPLSIFSEENSGFSVAIVNFSSSVICFAMTLLTLVCLPALILSIVSPYHRVRRVNESTHVNRPILGALVAVSISPQV